MVCVRDSASVDFGGCDYHFSRKKECDCRMTATLGRDVGRSVRCRRRCLIQYWQPCDRRIDVATRLGYGNNACIRVWTVVAGRYRIPGCARTFGTRTRRSLMWRRINSVRPLEQSDWVGSKTVTRTSPAFFLYFILFYFILRNDVPTRNDHVEMHQFGTGRGGQRCCSID